MVNSTDTKQDNGISFQQELIKKFLLEKGIISSQQIEQAIEEQKKYLLEGNKKLALKTYYIDQKNYSLIIKNHLTGELIKEVQFPFRKKNKPAYSSVDWFPIAGNSVVLFSDYECMDIGELTWESNEKIGITIGKEYSFLQIENTEKSYYFPTLNTLNYDHLPSESINSLPLDLYVTKHRGTIYFIDRGSGTLFLFDTNENKLSGQIHLRPPGSIKTINVTSTVDGKKVFASDGETPALFIIDSKKLNIKKQPLSYGNLSSLWADENWLYMLVDKPNSFPELVILDLQNLILRANIQLRGELFSKIDDPNNMMVASPSGKYILIMTYVNYPSLFTPIINVVDIESFELVDQIFLNDKSKPTYISFALDKPQELVNLNSDIIDIMIKLGFITEEHVLEALDNITGEDNYSNQNIHAPIAPPPEEGFGLIEEGFEERENQDHGISSEDKYPVLSNYDLDPSLLLAFKEEQMRHFKFLPINKIDGKLTLAVADPQYKSTLKQVIEQKFPELEVSIIDFTEDEFSRFMREFYSVIKDKYDSIIARNMEQAQDTHITEEKPQQVKNEETPKKEEIKSMPVKKEMPNKPPVPLRPSNKSPMPRTELPPNHTSSIPSEVRTAVREKLKSLDTDMLDEAIMAICVEDFHSIWGIELPKEKIEKYKNVIVNARKDILEKDYSFIKIENLVGDFSLEIVINQEKLVVMLKTLTDLAQKKYGETPNNTQVEQKEQNQEPVVKTDNKCQKCGVSIPPEIDICSKCSREAAHIRQGEDIRSPSSPNPLSALKKGHLLLADPLSKRVVELNESGQIVWKIGGKDKKVFTYPYSSIRLNSGTTIVTDAEEDRVIEFTRSGRIYWELKNREGFRDLFLRRPVQAIRLLNGNTLIVDQGNHRVFEVNHLDKIVWQYGTTATVGVTEGKLYSPSYVQRLSNGHTLITDTDNHRVIEIDQDDKIVWQYGNTKNKLGSGYGSGRDQLNSPMFSLKFDNGNILIVDTGNHRILEVNKEKQVTWHFSTSVEKGSPINVIPQKAYRKQNGNTIIISNEQIIEVNPEGQLIYIRQIEYLANSPEYKEEEISEEEEKIITDRLKKQSTEKAQKATKAYVKTMAKLSELEVALIDRASHKIQIVNRYKNIVWRFGEATEDSNNYLERPQFVQLIKDEYVLIADTDNHRVIKIYRPTKEIVWQYGITGAMGSGNNQLGHPRSAVITPDNNVLITDQYSSRVIEVSMEKEIKWSYGGWDGSNSSLNAPYYAERLHNGNTLITDWSNHIVIEVDLDKNIIWQYGTAKTPGKDKNQLMYPEKAIRTTEGNTIIVDTRNNRIIEVDDSNKIVWEFLHYKIGNLTRQLSNPTNVFRINNGNTVIVNNSNKHILEVDKNSQMVWQYQVPIERR